MSQQKQEDTGPDIYESYRNRQSAFAGCLLTGSGLLSIVFNAVAISVAQVGGYLCHGICCGIAVSKITLCYQITFYKHIVSQKFTIFIIHHVKLMTLIMIQGFKKITSMTISSLQHV